MKLFNIPTKQQYFRTNGLTMRNKKKDDSYYAYLITHSIEIMMNHFDHTIIVSNNTELFDTYNYHNTHF
jgi:energy-coupling factor transporter ATP-binding protein EcfA2